MNLAVSNIAWSADEEAPVARMLEALGVAHVEIAPTKVFADPTATTPEERRAYTEFWAQHGIGVVAFQSMLFGRADLQLFGDAATRREMVGVLSRFIELAGALGAGRLVFGSPKNRIVPEGMTPREADDLAVPFFAELAAVALSNNTVFCIEPNPVDYGCNFVTTASAGLALVQDIDHAGFGLHLDAAGMTLAGDDVADSIRAVGGRLKHFHASAPQLGPLENRVVEHSRAARALRDSGYSGYVSIEMRPGTPGSAPADVRAAVTLARQEYADVL